MCADKKVSSLSRVFLATHSLLRFCAARAMKKQLFFILLRNFVSQSSCLRKVLEEEEEEKFRAITDEANFRQSFPLLDSLLTFFLLLLLYYYSLSSNFPLFYFFSSVRDVLNNAAIAMTLDNWQRERSPPSSRASEWVNIYKIERARVCGAIQRGNGGGKEAELWNALSRI